MMEFFKYNSTNRGMITEGDYFASACKHGFVFGEIITDKVHVMKTFLSEDMLKGDQPILYEYLTNLLVDAEEFKKKDKTGLEYLKRMI